MTELKHCPFCGCHVAHMVETGEGYYAMCANHGKCGAMGLHVTIKETAAAAWSRRHA